MTNGQDKEAINYVNRLINEFPSWRLDLIKLKSFIYYKIKEYEKALNTINEIYDNLKDDPQILNNKAIILANLGREEEAISAGKKLVEIDPDSGNFHDSLGEILMMFKHYRDAIIEFEKALKLEPHGFFAYQTCLKMGLCYKELNEYQKAKSFFEKGKLITERLLPGDRELYEHKADKYLEDIKSYLS